MIYKILILDLETVILNEISQKENYHTASHIGGMEKKTVQINLFMKQKQSQRCKNQGSYPGKEGRGQQERMHFVAVQ